MIAVTPKKTGAWQPILGLLALAIVLVALVAMLPVSNQVTLKSGPFSDIVQMFERVGLGDEGKVTHFADGTPCTKLGEPSSVDFGDGDVLHFYHLTCNGTTGYVNVKWVR